MAAFQVCLQVWLATSLLADGLAVAGQVRIILFSLFHCHLCWSVGSLIALHTFPLDYGSNFSVRLTGVALGGVDPPLFGSHLHVLGHLNITRVLEGAIFVYTRQRRV